MSKKKLLPTRAEDLSFDVSHVKIRAFLAQKVFSEKKKHKCKINTFFAALAESKTQV